MAESGFGRIMILFNDSSTNDMVRLGSTSCRQRKKRSLVHFVYKRYASPGVTYISCKARLALLLIQPTSLSLVLDATLVNYMTRMHLSR